MANINDASNVITMLDALHKQFGEFNFSLEATVSYNWYQTPTTYSSLIVSVRTKLLHNQNISQLLYLLQSAPSSRLDCQILQPQQYRYFPARSYSTRGSRHCRKDIYISFTHPVKERKSTDYSENGRISDALQRMGVRMYTASYLSLSQ